MKKNNIINIFKLSNKQCEGWFSFNGELLQMDPDKRMNEEQ